MAEKLDILIDRFSRKEEICIDIDGTCNDEGILEQILPFTVRLNRDVTHKVALVTLGSTSFFPNLTRASNKFYYNNGVENKVLTIPSGTYEIKDYNERVKKLMKIEGDNSDNINISLDPATGKTEIELKESYKVYFDRERTWRECLGFEAINLHSSEVNSIHTSHNIAEVLPTQMIYIGCNICRGSIGNRDKKIRNNTLFSFPNNKAFGSPFVLAPNPLRPREVTIKEFDTIRLEFTDDDRKPVSFLGAQVTGELYIYQT